MNIGAFGVNITWKLWGGGSLSARGIVAVFLVWYNWNILGLSENGEGMNHVEFELDFTSMNSGENSME